MKQKILGMNLSQLQAYMQELGEKPFRAGQVMTGMKQGKFPFEMSNIPKALAHQLTQDFGGVTLSEIYPSKDGSEKYLFRCWDGDGIEGVRMEYDHGGSLCLSVQAGCRMGCVFCASGQEGLSRNLQIDELIGQVFSVKRQRGADALTHMVLMGCGEPFDNYDAVLSFLHTVVEETGWNFSARHIALSTCGLVEEMERFSMEGLPVTLCVSLHAPNDDIRRQFLPIAHRYPIGDVVEAAKGYEQRTGRRVVFEYTLIRGANDRPEQAQELVRLTKGIRKHINLIPLNAGENGLHAPTREDCLAFLAELQRLGVSATLRRTLADDIQGACGQLRRRRV